MARLTSELTKLRGQAMETLSSASKTRVGPMEAICRNTLGKLDARYQELQDAFISFDDELDRFLTKWLGPQVRFPDLNSHLSVNLCCQIDHG
jgi:hypothetical protein